MLEAGGYPSLVAKHSQGEKKATSRRNDTVTSAQMFAKSKNELESAVVQPQTRAHYPLDFSMEDKVRLCA